MESNTNYKSAKRLTGDLRFTVFVSLFAILAFKVAEPLFTPILWSAMLSFAAFPLFFRINRLTGERVPSIASLFTLVAIFMCFIMPIFYVVSSLAKEAADVTSKLMGIMSVIDLESVKDSSLAVPVWVPSWLENYVKTSLKDSSILLSLLKQIAKWSGTLLTSVSGSILHIASSFLFEVMVMAIVSFFFIRDGAKIVDYVKSMVPLSAFERDLFFKRAGGLLNSVIFGIMLTVAVQASLGALGWWFVGLPNPVFFGMLMFFVGMLPAGTAIVWLPGSVYLALTGDVKNATVLLLWGVIVISTIDNFLRPLLISGGKDSGEVSTLLIMLGLFGGLITWGFVGIFLGPLALVLFKLVLDICRTRWQKEEGNDAC